MKVKVIDLNKSALDNLLERLKDKRYLPVYKENKGKTGIFPPNWTSIKPYETDFKDTTYTIIPLEHNKLFVIDIDNIYTFNRFLEVLKRFKINTLITKSPYGAHIYFKYDKHIKIPNIDHTIFLETGMNKAEKAIKGNQLKMDFKCYGDKGCILDGYNNGYYEVYNDIEPVELSDDIIKYLLSLSNTTSDPSYNIINKSSTLKYFNPDKYTFNFIKKWIDSDDIDIDEFLLLWNSKRKDYRLTTDLITYNREIHLFLISSWAGNTGYFESFEQWKTFVELAYENLIPDKTGFDSKRLKSQVILSPAKFKEKYYTNNETEKLLGTLKSSSPISIETISQYDKYLAINANATSNSDRIVFIDLSKNNSFKVNYLANNDIAVSYSLKIPEFKERYISVDNKGKFYINTNTLPIISFKNLDNESILYSYDSNNFIVFNLNYFTMNPLIKTLYRETKDIDKELIIDKYKETSFYKILSKNLIPDNKIRSKFIGDLAHYIKKPQPLLTALTIKDRDGSAGKDHVLTSYLRSIIFGTDYDIGESEANTLYSKETNGILDTSESALTFMKNINGFNDTMKSRLYIINEDGASQDSLGNSIGVRNDLFYSAWQNLIKVPTVNINPKGKTAHTIKNKMFTLRYTNSYNRIAPNRQSNTRFYFCDAYSYYDLTDNNTYELLFGTDIKDTIKKEIPVIMEYLLFCAEEDKDYVGYYKLPESIAPSEILESRDLDEVIENSDDYTPDEMYEIALDRYINNNNEFIVENIIKDSKDKKCKTPLTVRILNSAGFRKHPDLFDSTNVLNVDERIINIGIVIHRLTTLSELVTVLTKELGIYGDVRIRKRLMNLTYNRIRPNRGKDISSMNISKVVCNKIKGEN